MRGEYPWRNKGYGFTQGSPPLARGIPCKAIANGRWERITPACAGNTPHGQLICNIHRDHPRLRGEYNDVTENGIVLLGSPPLARGIHDIIAQMIAPPRITPACAGNTFPIWKLYSTPQDHPRLRGEYSPLGDRLAAHPGSPPLARGIHITDEIRFDPSRITPACAGNT